MFYGAGLVRRRRVYGAEPCGRRAKVAFAPRRRSPPHHTIPIIDRGNRRVGCVVRRSTLFVMADQRPLIREDVVGPDFEGMRAIKLRLVGRARCIADAAEQNDLAALGKVQQRMAEARRWRAFRLALLPSAARAVVHPGIGVEAVEAVATEEHDFLRGRIVDHGCQGARRRLDFEPKGAPLVLPGGVDRRAGVGTRRGQSAAAEEEEFFVDRIGAHRRPVEAFLVVTGLGGGGVFGREVFPEPLRRVVTQRASAHQRVQASVPRGDGSEVPHLRLPPPRTDNALLVHHCEVRSLEARRLHGSDLGAPCFAFFGKVVLPLICFSVVGHDVVGERALDLMGDHARHQKEAFQLARPYQRRRHARTGLPAGHLDPLIGLRGIDDRCRTRQQQYAYKDSDHRFRTTVGQDNLDSVRAVLWAAGRKAWGARPFTREGSLLFRSGSAGMASLCIHGLQRDQRPIVQF